MEGRTPVPEKESIQSFAAHHATMVVFLSTGMLEELSRRLIEGGYTADTPAAIVYKGNLGKTRKPLSALWELWHRLRKKTILLKLH